MLSLSDRIWNWIACRLPKRLVFWCLMRAAAKFATAPKVNRRVIESVFAEATYYWEQHA